jgi:hypothetical protein
VHEKNRLLTFPWYSAAVDPGWPAVDLCRVLTSQGGSGSDRDQTPIPAALAISSASASFRSLECIESRDLELSLKQNNNVVANLKPKEFWDASRCTQSVQPGECFYTSNDQVRRSQIVHKPGGLLGCFSELLTLSFKRFTVALKIFFQ